MTLKVGDVFVVARPGGEVSEFCIVKEPGKAWVLNGYWDASFSETALTGVYGKAPNAVEFPIIWRGTPPADPLRHGESALCRWIEKQLDALEQSPAP